MYRKCFLVGAALIAFLSACALPGQSIYPNGQKAMISELLYFGTTTPGGIVTGEDWQGFLNQSVTPQFPGGLSIWPASGQWKLTTSPIIHEASYVLNIIHEGNITTSAALDEIARTCKTPFQQEAVLRVRGATSVSF